MHSYGRDRIGAIHPAGIVSQRSVASAAAGAVRQAAIHPTSTMAMLRRMCYWDWTFREAEVRLSQRTELRATLKLSFVADRTTLYRLLTRPRAECIMTHSSLHPGALSQPNVSSADALQECVGSCERSSPQDRYARRYPVETAFPVAKRKLSCCAPGTTITMPISQTLPLGVTCIIYRLSVPAHNTRMSTETEGSHGC